LAVEFPEDVTAIILINAFENLKNALVREVGNKLHTVLWMFRNHMNHQEEIKDVSVPILGIGCEKDRMCPPFCLRTLLANATKSPLVRMTIAKDRKHAWSLFWDGACVSSEFQKFIQDITIRKTKNIKAYHETEFILPDEPCEGWETAAENPKVKILDLKCQHHLLNLSFATEVSIQKEDQQVATFVESHLLESSPQVIQLNFEVQQDNNDEDNWICTFVVLVCFAVILLLILLFIFLVFLHTRT
jgi:hypothetical protein